MTTLVKIDVAAVCAAIDAIRADYSSEYVWGVRFDDPGLPVGHIFHSSRVWDDGEPTGEMMDGTATIDARSLHVLRHIDYCGTPYIVCGIFAGYGQDDGETIMTECEIMEVIQ